MARLAGAFLLLSSLLVACSDGVETEPIDEGADAEDAGARRASPDGAADAADDEVDAPAGDAGVEAGGDDEPPIVGELQTCQASYYQSGSKTANGESFDPNGMTAAHRTLAFNTRLRVTNKANGKSVDVRINDRGPFGSSRRCLDLARGAFAAIAPLSAGVITVEYGTLAN
ncbi:MAG: septal ring lytic transglycosylase RlpA family protein [Labilithrix sp.]|nr:septal ring lytic transglycosylase RlpA family protein [Labilithrix sp.]